MKRIETKYGPVWGYGGEVGEVEEEFEIIEDEDEE